MKEVIEDSPPLAHVDPYTKVRVTFVRNLFSGVPDHYAGYINNKFDKNRKCTVVMPLHFLVYKLVKDGHISEYLFREWYAFAARVPFRFSEISVIEHQLSQLCVNDWMRYMILHDLSDRSLRGLKEILDIDLE